MSFLNRYVSERTQNPEFQKEWKESQVEYELARQIIKMRKERGITQEKLAQLLNTKQSAISRIENGDHNITLDTLKKLASVFNETIKVEINPDISVNGRVPLKN